MSASAPGSDCVVVLGGTRHDRALVISSLLRESGSTALVLTSSAHLLDPDLDTGDDGTVEVRADDPLARLESFRAGAVDPDDLVLAALAAGSDAPLSAVLGWEYTRRAVAAGAWDTVVVELDGASSALRRLGAAAELAVFVERHWPSHQRYAAMAAGAGAPAAVREAHRLATTVDDVAGFLADPRVRVEVAGESAAERARLRRLGDVARGAAGIRVDATDDGRYLARVDVPGECADPVVEGDRLVLRVDGLTLAPTLPALLRRCAIRDWWVEESDRIGADEEGAGDAVVVSFLPDPDLWPPNLHTRVSAAHAG